MDLESGHLYWPSLDKAFPRAKTLRGRIRCDIAIVGAGVTGALTAHSLIEAGFDVVLLDKRRVGTGSTAASTALVLYEIDVPLVRLHKMIGRERARHSYRLCQEAIGKLEVLTRSLANPCGFQSKNSLQLASYEKDVDGLQAECRARTRLGLNVQYLNSSELKSRFSYRAPAALWSADAAVVNPYRLTRQLILQAEKNRLRRYETTVQSWEVARTGVTLKTVGGEVMAKTLVIAGGYESQGWLKKKLVTLKSSYAIATQPLELPPAQAQLTVWETAQPYHYLRTTEDGRLIMGGEDEDFYDPERRDALIPRKAALLCKAIRKWHPQLKPKVEFAWAGTFGETHDGLPYIGSLPGQPRVIYGLCYGANGVNFAVLASEIIRDRLLHRRTRATTLFSLTR